MAERFDFVVVGGGVYGVATAWHLAKLGAEVVVVEQNRIASGASGGIGKRGVRANGRDMRELPLMEDAYRRWPDLADELDAPTGYERTGQMTLYERHHDVGAAEARRRIQAGHGIPTDHLTADQARELEPGLSAVVMGALHCPYDGVADHTATTRAYAQAATRLGTVIREERTVTEFAIQGDQVSGVRLEDESLIEVGRAVLLLANSGVPALVEPVMGRALPVWTVYPQVVRSTPIHPPPVRGLIGHAHRPLAVKMMADSCVMLSGGWRGTWDASEQRPRTLPRYVNGNWAEAVAVFPALVECEVAEANADRAETLCFDAVPIIDQVPGLSNVLMGVGWTGHGWAIAPAVAPHLATWALTGSCPDLLRPFSLARFATSKRS